MSKYLSSITYPVFVPDLVARANSKKQAAIRNEIKNILKFAIFQMIGNKQWTEMKRVELLISLFQQFFYTKIHVLHVIYLPKVFL